MAHVLICDDDRNFAAACGALIEEMGHAVSAAYTIDDAMLMMNRHNFDLAILDVIMPNGGAITLAYKMRQSFPAVRIVVCTGRDFVFDSPVVELGLNIVDAKIRKTIDPVELGQLLQRVLAVPAKLIGNH